MDVVNRTFVGIQVPEEAARKMQEGMLLLKRKPGVDNIRWSAPSEYLIQVASLGEIAASSVANVRVVLPPLLASFPPFRLQIKGFTGTPNLIQPRFVHAELEGDTQLLEQISQAVDRAVAPYVPNREVKPFKASIVIGRLKTESEHLRVALGRALKMTQIPEMGSIEVRSIGILMSHANESGIRYALSLDMPLKGGVGP